MAKRSKVTTLPIEVKTWLDRALIDGNFSEYQALSDALKVQGFDISKSALHRYGSDFEERLDTLKVASEQARAIVQANPDEEDSMGEALTRLVQEKMFTALMKINVNVDKLTLPAMAKAIAEVAKASTSQKKWATEMRAKATAVAVEVDTLVKKAGLTEESASLIRAKILGIV